MENSTEDSKTKDINDQLVSLEVLRENDRRIKCFFIDNS